MKGWYGNRQAHMLASRGIKTRTINMALNPFEDDIPQYYKIFGFDFDKTVVHGTSLENAKKIKEDGWLRNGTFVHAGFGGLTDAYNWSKNSFSNPVVIMVEVDIDEPLRVDRQWVTLGERGAEREGIDKIYDKLKIKKMIVFKVPEKKKFKSYKEEEEWYDNNKKDWYGNMVEVKI